MWTMFRSHYNIMIVQLIVQSYVQFAMETKIVKLCNEWEVKDINQVLMLSAYSGTKDVVELSLLLGATNINAATVRATEAGHREDNR